MNMKKIISCAAAVAMTASLMAIAADATNWANASYSDNDPSTVSIISTDENKVVFTSTADGAQAKCRITASELLAEEDLAKVKSATWTVTYDGFTPDMDPANGVGGGTYFAFKNSTSYWISPDYDEDGNPYWGSSSYSAEDSVKFLLPTEVLASDSELVFIDWSSYPLVSNNITITVSDLKFFDENGNEIAQKAYEGAAAADTTAADTTAAPAADTTTTSTNTGNAAAASIAAVMAVAGAAAVAARKRK